MRLIFTTLLFLSLTSCRQKDINITSEKLELILIGLPQNFDTADFSKMGVQKYFCFNGSDSLLVKSCTYINEKTGEPILPVSCNYYIMPISSLTKSQFQFFINYLKPINNGELIKNRPEEVYCDLFGGWIAIYTGANEEKKYFVFDCYGLPESIHKLCNNINYHGLDTSLINISSDINTDSITQTAQKILYKEFTNQMTRNSIKFIKPE